MAPPAAENILDENDLHEVCCDAVCEKSAVRRFCEIIIFFHGAGGLSARNYN
jgi:hypothetical protein